MFDPRMRESFGTRGLFLLDRIELPAPSAEAVPPPPPPLSPPILPPPVPMVPAPAPERSFTCWAPISRCRSCPWSTPEVTRQHARPRRGLFRPTITALLALSLSVRFRISRLSVVSADVDVLFSALGFNGCGHRRPCFPGKAVTNFSLPAQISLAQVLAPKTPQHFLPTGCLLYATIFTSFN
uniref:(northern house mosquito) hypothetical protein n=1 Tax=Culex pipiens TaxID=7175 RepID=A0A8D8A099_CULPI